MAHHHFRLLQHRRQTSGTSAGVFTVRSRVRQDLEKLKCRNLPGLTEIAMVEGRTTATEARRRSRLSLGPSERPLLTSTTLTSRTQSRTVRATPRHDAYAKVWQNLNDDLAAIDHADAASPEGRGSQGRSCHSSRKERVAGAAGGVVFDKLGRLILREPKGHFGHYVWTYGKGQVQSGESHEQTALREVLVRPVQRQRSLTVLVISQVIPVLPASSSCASCMTQACSRRRGRRRPC